MLRTYNGKEMEFHRKNAYGQDEVYSRDTAIRAIRKALQKMQTTASIKAMCEDPWDFDLHGIAGITEAVADYAMSYGLQDEVLLNQLQAINAAIEPYVAIYYREAGEEPDPYDPAVKIAEYCTDALQYNLCKPTEQAPRRVPDELSPEAKKCFAKALQAGYMTEVEGGYRWVYCNGLKASLGYFLHEVFNPDGCSTIPYKKLERLFGVSRLDRTIDQVVTTTNKQKWKEAIDRLFE